MSAKIYSNILLTFLLLTIWWVATLFNIEGEEEEDPQHVYYWKHLEIINKDEGPTMVKTPCPRDSHHKIGTMESDHNFDPSLETSRILLLSNGCGCCKFRLIIIDTS